MLTWGGCGRGSKAMARNLQRPTGRKQMVLGMQMQRGVVVVVEVVGGCMLPGLRAHRGAVEQQMQLLPPCNRYLGARAWVKRTAARCCGTRRQSRWKRREGLRGALASSETVSKQDHACNAIQKNSSRLMVMASTCKPSSSCSCPGLRRTRACGFRHPISRFFEKNHKGGDFYRLKFGK